MPVLSRASGRKAICNSSFRVCSVLMVLEVAALISGVPALLLLALLVCNDVTDVESRKYPGSELRFAQWQRIPAIDRNKACVVPKILRGCNCRFFSMPHAKQLLWLSCSQRPRRFIARISSPSDSQLSERARGWKAHSALRSRWSSF